MEQLSHKIYDYLIDLGLSSTWAAYINMAILLIGVLIILFFVDFILRKLLIGLFTRLSLNSKTHFDDFLVKNRAPRNIAHVIPLIILHKAVPYVFNDFQMVESLLLKAIEVLGIFLFLWIIRSLLYTIEDFLKTIPGLKDKPIDS